MPRKTFAKETIVTILAEAEAGTSVKDLCKKYGMSNQAFYRWRTMAAEEGAEPIPVGKTGVSKKLTYEEGYNHRLTKMQNSAGNKKSKLSTSKSSKAPSTAAKASVVKPGRRSVTEMTPAERRHELYKRQGDVLRKFDFPSALIALQALDVVAPTVTVRDLKTQAGDTLHAAIEANKDSNVLVKSDAYGFEAVNLENRSLELRLILAK